MEITEVRIFPVEDAKLKAFVSIIFDDCFVISDIKIIKGPKGLFISMPSKKQKDGTFRDIAHPLNSTTRQMMEETVLSRYRADVNVGQALSPRVIAQGQVGKDESRVKNREELSEAQGGSV